MEQTEFDVEVFRYQEMENGTSKQKMVVSERGDRQ
jgi:hypothetical protein